MKKAIRILLVGLVASTLLTACTNPPNDKVTEANALIQSVIAAGGEDFSPEKMASIQKKYLDAQEEIKDQGGLLFKNYAVAEYTLNQLMDDCDELKNKIAESKGEPIVAVAKRVKFAAE